MGTLHKIEFGQSDFNGGIILFSTCINSSEITENKLLDWGTKQLKTFKSSWFQKRKFDIEVDKSKDNDDKYIGAISIGNFFYGKYGIENEYNDKSLSLEIGEYLLSIY